MLQQVLLERLRKSLDRRSATAITSKLDENEILQIRLRSTLGRIIVEKR